MPTRPRVVRAVEAALVVLLVVLALTSGCAHREPYVPAPPEYPSTPVMTPYAAPPPPPPVPSTHMPMTPPPPVAPVPPPVPDTAPKAVALPPNHPPPAPDIVPAPQRLPTLAAPVTIPPPDVAAAEVPAGYAVEVAVANLMYPSSLAFDGAGNLYIAECGSMPGDATQPARILKLPVPDAARVTPTVVAEGLSAPITDLLWHDGRLFVSHKGKVSVLEDGHVRDLVTGLPSLGDHGNNQMSVGPEGRLYFGQGSATNSGVVGPDNFAFGWAKTNPEVCETSARDVRLTGQVFESEDPRQPEGTARATTSAYQPFGTTVPAGTLVKGRVKANGTVLSMDLDGGNLAVHAWGFRNPYGVCWGPDGQLYVADAGSDERGSRQVAAEPEKLCRVVEGGWYGWPDYFAGHAATEPQFKSSGQPAPQFLFEEHPALEQPWMTFDVHSSITQIAFSRDAAFGAQGQLFLASSGDQAAVTSQRDVRAGYWVKKVDPATARAETFFRTRPEKLGPPGREYVETAGPKRLVDLAFTPEGDALYVVDIGPIHYEPGPKGPEPKAFPRTGVVWCIRRTLPPGP